MIRRLREEKAQDRRRKIRDGKRIRVREGEDSRQEEDQSTREGTSRIRMR